MMSTTKSVAIVTGASSGIGRATAIRLARDFAVIVLAARDKDDLDQAAAEVKSVGAEAIVYALDLRQPESAKTIVEGTLARFGRIDALLNIAGAVAQIDLFQMTDAQWDDGMALKFHGARRLTIRAWDALKASNGSVVFMSGSAAFGPKPQFAAVATINAAINALAKAFAEQGIKDGVQVNSVSPGLLRKVGARPQSHGGRSDQEISRTGRHRAHGKAGRDCRSDGLSRFPRCKVDDRCGSTDGWRRD